MVCRVRKDKNAVRRGARRRGHCSSRPLPSLALVNACCDSRVVAAVRKSTHGFRGAKAR